jgi:hypothetical protein
MQHLASQASVARQFLHHCSMSNYAECISPCHGGRSACSSVPAAWDRCITGDVRKVAWQPTSLKDSVAIGFEEMWG